MKTKLLKRLTFLLLTDIIFISACVKPAQTCEQTTNNKITVDFLFEKDGCKVYRFIDGGYAIYYTTCTGNVEYNIPQRGNTIKKQTLCNNQ